MTLSVIATAIVGLVHAPHTGFAQCCGDCNGNGQVTINELIGAVNNDLNGCPAAQSILLATAPLSVSSGTNGLLTCSAVNIGSVSLDILVANRCDNGSAAAPNNCTGLGPGRSCNLTEFAGTGSIPLNCWCEFTVTGGSAASVRAGMQVYPDLPGTIGTLPPQAIPAFVLPANATGGPAAQGDILATPPLSQSSGQNGVLSCDALNIGSVPLDIVVANRCDNGSAAVPNSCTALGAGRSCNLTEFAGTASLPLNCWCEFTVTGGSAASVRAGGQVYPDLPGTIGTLPPQAVPAFVLPAN